MMPCWTRLPRDYDFDKKKNLNDENPLKHWILEGFSMSSYRMKYKIGATQYHIPVVDDMAGFGSGIPLGTILPYSANSEYPPEGFLWCDGSAISRSAYPDLFALIGTLYGSGDGVSTFNLPDLNMGEFLEGSSTAGTAKNAGLPNIKGVLRGIMSVAGAFDRSTFYTNLQGVNSGGYPVYYVNFDASLSSSVYKDDVTTVQPKSVTVRYIIKAFSATSSNSELVDVTELSTEITKKFDPSTDFTFVYPNNGTEQNPANITVDSDYILSNPFPGYAVSCQVEVLYNNEWGVVQFNGWGLSNSGYYGEGACCLQRGSGDLVLIVGNHTLKHVQVYRHNIAPTTFVGDTSTSSSNSLPARVKVWKVGKLPQSS